MTASAPVASIGPEDLLEIIKQDVFRLRYAWANFRYLFASEKKTVDVLNAVGPGFFGMAQRLMLDDVILRICRLTDPAANRNQENTTLKRLLQATGWETSDPAKHALFLSKTRSADAASKDCRDHRNKRISHADLQHSQKAFGLPDATMKMIDGAVTAIEQFIRDINYELHPGVEQSFQIIDGDRDVKQLMYHLENRASLKRPDAISRIVHAGGNSADFECAFCGERSAIAFYPKGVPTPRLMVRWHFDKCHGVVGHETISVEAVDSRGIDASFRFTVDLSIPTRETDP